MFPAAAALGWAVLVYIGIDFGFWGKVFDMSSGAERIWRASGEAILAGTLLVFLFAYLNLNRWHVRYMHITLGWLAFLARARGDRADRRRRSPPASRGCRLSCVAVARLRARDLSLDPRLRPRGAADPDLVPAGGLGDRRRRSTVTGYRHQRHRRPGAARRPRADRHADRLHRDAARLRRRHHPQHRLRRRAARAGADRRRRHDLGLGRVRPTGSTPARRPSSCSGSSAARSKARRRAGSKCCIRSTATASAPRSTACSSSAAAGWCRISACARRTAITCGSRSRRGPWSAPTARWCGSSAR